MKRNVLVGAAAALTVSAGLAWATPDSGLTAVVLQRSAIDGRIKIQTRPRDLNDILVQQITVQPGGQSGWHSHPGPVIVAIKSGAVGLYAPVAAPHAADGKDSSRHSSKKCTVEYFTAGSAYFVEANAVHLVRNEGAVATEDVETFVLPVGVPAFTDEPAPGGDCPS